MGPPVEQEDDKERDLDKRNLPLTIECPALVRYPNKGTARRFSLRDGDQKS